MPIRGSRNAGHAPARMYPAAGRLTGSQPPPRRGQRMTAHLRSRGKHPAASPGGGADIGSPPPPRRGRPLPRLRLGQPRFTSACAERTPTRSSARPGASAHLRLRGEHLTRPSASPVRYKSAPPARRPQRSTQLPVPPGRLTSAPAESTPGAWPRPGSGTAHLRSRGEHSSTVTNRPFGSGSPPLPRRALMTTRWTEDTTRLTSAPAESTASAEPKPSPKPAHLRSRGEHRSCSRSRSFSAGSPPLPRRARTALRVEQPERRLTSAPAESTK